MKLETITEALTQSEVSKTEWFKELGKYGEPYFVGGAVRDELIGGVESKDVDLVVRGLKYREIARILKKYGKVNMVGQSFGVIKFVPKGEDEEVDIALPRTEKKAGTGHQGFDINADPNISLIKDLERRDFTINAIAKDSDGNIVDPFGGRQDADRKIIRAVSKQSFSDDPLRMLRAVQFASRFGFTIEPETMKMIQAHASDIKQISGERIIIEFDKIIRKGKPELGIKLLNQTGLFKALFGQDFKGDAKEFRKVKTMGEFVYLTLQQFSKPDNIYKSQLRGDNTTQKEIQALAMARSIPSGESKGGMRWFASRVLATHDVSKSQLLPQPVKKAIREIQGSKYPSGIGELAIGGRDLVDAGINPRDIGDVLRNVLISIYHDRIPNTKEAIMGIV